MAWVTETRRVVQAAVTAAVVVWVRIRTWRADRTDTTPNPWTLVITAATVSSHISAVEVRNPLSIGIT